MGLRGTSDCSYINLRNNCTWSFWGINFQHFPHSISAAASLMFFSSPSSLWVEFKSLFLLRLHDQIPSIFLGSRFLLNCLYELFPTETQTSRTVASKHSSAQSLFSQGLLTVTGIHVSLGKYSYSHFPVRQLLFSPLPCSYRRKKKYPRHIGYVYIHIYTHTHVYLHPKSNSLNCKLFLELLEFNVWNSGMTSMSIFPILNSSKMRRI